MKSISKSLVVIFILVVILTVSFSFFLYKKSVFIKELTKLDEGECVERPDDLADYGDYANEINSEYELSGKYCDQQNIPSITSKKIKLSEFNDSSEIMLDQRLFISKDDIPDTREIIIDYDKQELSLCGKTYISKQIIINDVDIMKRFANILSSDNTLSNWFCQITLENAQKTGGIIPSGKDTGYEATIWFKEIGVDEYYFSLALGIGNHDITTNVPNVVIQSLGGTVFPDKNLIFINSNSYLLYKEQ